MIRIAYYVDQFATPRHFAFLDRSIESARAHMAGARVIHLTTPGAPRVKSADERIEVPADGTFPHRRGTAAALVPGDTLFLDCDTVIQSDVVRVFDNAFDIALAQVHRPGFPDLKYNAGVVFSRCPRFWTDFARRAGGYDYKDVRTDWRPIERTFSETAASGDYRVFELDSTLYNHTPASADEDVSRALIVHYKGIRKKWVLGPEPKAVTAPPPRRQGILMQLLRDIFRRK
jgi:hypothetical protein